MKKVLVFLFVVMVVMSYSVFAAEDSRAEKMSFKLARGMTNVATAPGEYLIQTPVAVEKSPDYLTGFFNTIFRGTAFTLRRLGAGLYDVVTFPFPGKTDYAPVIQPETIVTKAVEPIS